MSWVIVERYTAETMRSGCLICANGEVREGPDGPEPILSSGYADEFAGTPEICATCIGEAAAMIGWKSGPAFAKEQERRKVAEAEVEETRQQLADKTATVRTLTNELAEAVAEAPREKVSARR